MEIIVENNSQSKYRIVEFILKDYIYSTTLTPQALLWKRQGEIVNARKIAVRLCFLIVSEATSVKFHQHEFLNMS